jgi:hypothetical protein
MPSSIAFVECGSAKTAPMNAPTKPSQSPAKRKGKIAGSASSPKGVYGPIATSASTRSGWSAARRSDRWVPPETQMIVTWSMPVASRTASA